MSTQSFSVTLPYERCAYVSDLLRTLEEHASALGIEEITMNLSSLEEISFFIYQLYNNALIKCWYLLKLLSKVKRKLLYLWKPSLHQPGNSPNLRIPKR
jgi:hypothetical protein